MVRKPRTETASPTSKKAAKPKTKTASPISKKAGKNTSRKEVSVSPKAKLKHSTNKSTRSSGMRQQLVDKGRSMCVFSGLSLFFCDGAHIFPKVWINDGSYKRRIPRVPLKVLNGPENRIMMNQVAHRAFDLDMFCLKSTRAKDQYRVVLRSAPKQKNRDIVVRVPTQEEINYLSTQGVTDGKIVTITGLEVRCVKWRFEEFAAFRPTGAGQKDESDSSSTSTDTVEREEVNDRRVAMCEEAARYVPHILAVC